MAKLRITALRDGRRRAGRAWSAAGEVVDTKDFNAEQLAALKADPLLEVLPIRVEPDEPKGKK